jgi:hypothetical protein
VRLFADILAGIFYSAPQMPLVDLGHRATRPGSRSLPHTDVKAAGWTKRSHQSQDHGSITNDKTKAAPQDAFPLSFDEDAERRLLGEESPRQRTRLNNEQDQCVGCRFPRSRSAH